MDNIYEEMGCGDLNQAHPILYLTMLESIGVTAEAAEGMSPLPSIGRINDHLREVVEQRHFSVTCAVLASAEATIPPSFPVLAGMARNAFPDVDMTFFDFGVWTLGLRLPSTDFNGLLDPPAYESQAGSTRVETAAAECTRRLSDCLEGVSELCQRIADRRIFVVLPALDLTAASGGERIEIVTQLDDVLFQLRVGHPLYDLERFDCCIGGQFCASTQ